MVRLQLEKLETAERGQYDSSISAAEKCISLLTMLKSLNAQAEVAQCS